MNARAKDDETEWETVEFIFFHFLDGCRRKYSLQQKNPSFFLWTENNERILQVVRLHHSHRRLGCRCWIGVGVDIGVKQFAYIVLRLCVQCRTMYNVCCIHSSLRLFDFSHPIRYSTFTSRPLLFSHFSGASPLVYLPFISCLLDNWNIASSIILSVCVRIYMYILR